MVETTGTVVHLKAVRGRRPVVLAPCLIWHTHQVLLTSWLGQEQWPMRKQVKLLSRVCMLLNTSLESLEKYTHWKQHIVLFLQPFNATRINVSHIKSRVNELSRSEDDRQTATNKGGFWEEFEVRVQRSKTLLWNYMCIPNFLFRLCHASMSANSLKLFTTCTRTVHVAPVVCWLSHNAHVCFVYSNYNNKSTCIYFRAKMAKRQSVNPKIDTKTFCHVSDISTLL